MKRCPHCSRTYPDDQNFCFDDGSTLEAATPPSSFDQSEAPTANYPYPGRGAAQTDMRHVAPTAGARPHGTVPPPPTPPPAYMMTPYAQKRSPLPWILAGLGALIIGVAVILLLSNRKSGQPGISTGPTPGVTPGTTPRLTPSPSYSPAPTPTGSWQTVSGEGFTVSMPGNPSHDEDTVPSAAGPLPLHLYTLSEGYEAFISGYTEYPDYLFDATTPDDLMDSVPTSIVSNLQGEITSQRPVTIDGNPGREIVGNSPSKNLGFTVRIYIVRPKMYMMLYTQYGKDKPVTAAGERFLESFQLTK
ncbi:MAG TPA: hypothetical protein VJ715_12675 [Pyrinomonadaceae bacterium]|nr:hypothetical protein [Pyrinomonadaceae bacterium]